KRSVVCRVVLKAGVNEIGFQNQLKNYLTCGWRGSNLIIMNNSQGNKFIIGFMCATNILPLIAFTWKPERADVKCCAIAADSKIPR
ncbi:unnamed protein product, partial [Callosobruchus maculatus]